MQLILVTNIYENPKFPEFLAKASSIYPHAHFFAAGDLLNSSPPPEGDLLERSILGELFGTKVSDEMRRLVGQGWKKVEQSFMVDVYRNMILPTGRYFNQSQQLANTRYHHLFAQLEKALKGRNFYFIPGNTDYPLLAHQHTQRSAELHCLDNQVIELNGVKIGALGGVPNTIHPFRGIVEVAPYEMTEAEYERRLRNLEGVDVLVTHTALNECGPFFANFIAESSVKILICREAYHAHRYQEAAEVIQKSIHKTKIIELRPFDSAEFETPVLTLMRETLDSPQIEFLK